MNGGHCEDQPELRDDSPVYAVYDERLEQDGAVVRFTGEFVNHNFRGGRGAFARRTRGRERHGKGSQGMTGAVYCEGMLGR